MTLKASWNFDSDTLGGAPAGWTRSAGTIVVSDEQSVSSPHSVKMPYVSGGGLLYNSSLVDSANGVSIMMCSIRINSIFHSTYGDTNELAVELYGASGALITSQAIYVMTQDSPGTGVWVAFPSGPRYYLSLDTWYHFLIICYPSKSRWYSYIANDTGGYMEAGAGSMASAQGIGKVKFLGYAQFYIDNVAIYDSSTSSPLDDIPVPGLQPGLEINEVELADEINEAPRESISSVSEVS